MISVLSQNEKTLMERFEHVADDSVIVLNKID